MKALFFAPPAHQTTGGLDAAIVSMRRALELQGIEVSDEMPVRPENCIAHFHGLWQRSFPVLSRECRRAGVRFVVSPHGMLEPWARRKKWWKKWSYFQLVEKRWIAHASCVLATAEPEAARLRTIFPKSRVESLPLGLTSGKRPDYASARSRLGWSADETVLLFLSRIHEKKGLDLLLHALAELRGNVPSRCRMVIVGPDEQPDYAACCRKFIAQNSARLPRTDWIGPVWGDERWPYFQGADLFCLPTHSENFGLAVLEACQVGTPALTTTETPWAESLGDSRGYIAQPQVADIRAQLARFFAQPQRNETDRSALSQWAWENFEWAKLAPRYAALYESILRTH